MNAITFIVLGLIGYWIYFSIKNEGIFWIPKAVLGLGSFGLWITLIFKVCNLLLKTPYYFLGGIIAAILGATIIFPISYRLLDAIEKKIEKRMGKKPYK